MPEVDYDLAVVGGGLLGALAAHFAAKELSGARTVIIEANTIGSGATRWSAGLCFPVARTVDHRRFVRRSQEFYEQTAPVSLRGCLREVEMVDVVHDRGSWSRCLVGTQLLPCSPAVRTNLAETLGSDIVFSDGEAVLQHDRRTIVVNAHALTQALLRLADMTEIKLRTRATYLSYRADHFVVETSERSILTRRVILACGPWRWPLGVAEILDEVPRSRVKRVAALYAAAPVDNATPCLHFVDDDIFILPTGPGRVLISFRRSAWDADPERLDGTASAEDMREGCRELQRRCPQLVRKVIGAVASCDSYTESRLPRVLSGVPGVAAVVGASGSGVRLGPALAADAVATVVKL